MSIESDIAFRAREDCTRSLVAERDAWKADAERLAAVLRRVRSDRPSVHTDRIWLEMAVAISLHEEMERPET